MNAQQAQEMVDAMGGPRSEGYEHFKRYCCQGYNIIRRQAPLLLSLLELLRDAGINDFSVWQDADKAIDGVKEKLQLHLEAIHAIKPACHRTYALMRTVRSLK